MQKKSFLLLEADIKKSWYFNMKLVCEFSFIHTTAEISQRLISESNLCIRTEFFSQGSLLKRAQTNLISFLHKSLSEVTTYILLVKTSVLRQI